MRNNWMRKALPNVVAASGIVMVGGLVGCQSEQLADVPPPAPYEEPLAHPETFDLASMDAQPVERQAMGSSIFDSNTTEIEPVAPIDYPVVPEPIAVATPDPAPVRGAASSTPTTTLTLMPAEPVRATSAAPTGRPYKVQKGDTLWSIARQFYGTGARWQDLAAANNISNPKKLYVGKQIIIPN